ncbi:MAG: hypothetical protein QF797_00205 [Alphaproteobacteria bacterium]|jgi:hypothetical protein|nr:hypothetical protein [Alphaproteobacteria bacterium]MDP6622546.1 hypothetical protein [Alphaproteobacteria bacterium]|tara:strand:+ start:398 stop:589 length:192 start_codon:yes stop_codon:yes gene_type:complete
MKRNDFWAVVLVVAVFSGFMMGYSVPPMVDVGYIGGGGAASAGPKTDMKPNLEEYYRKLQEQD